MRTAQPTSGVHDERDERYRALCAVVRQEASEPLVRRLAKAARYAEVSLVPIAAAVWLHNAMAMLTR